jgi:hypothetical protein
VQFERRTVASAQARHLRPDTDEAAEHRGALLDGGSGGKTAAQGERRTIQHKSDTERGAGVPRVERRAPSGAGKEERAVHCFAASCDAESAAEELRSSNSALRRASLRAGRSAPRRPLSGNANSPLARHSPRRNRDNHADLPRRQGAKKPPNPAPKPPCSRPAWGAARAGTAGGDCKPAGRGPPPSHGPRQIFGVSGPSSIGPLSRHGRGRGCNGLRQSRSPDALHHSSS